jgi:hypothetical protein
MGSMKTHGTKSEAPKYSSNSIGTPNWSGISESEFTPKLESELRTFITFESKLKGHNDSNNDRLGENKTFFHVDFLSGWPQKLWDQMYELGVAEYFDRKN